MAAIADAAAERGIWIIVDLCYEQLIYEPVPHNLPKVLFDRHARPDGALRVGVEGVRDDRLALRLGDRAEGASRPRATRSRATRRRTSSRSRRRRRWRRSPARRTCVTTMLDEYRAAPRQHPRLAHGGPADRVREAGGRLLPVPATSRSSCRRTASRTSADFAQALLEKEHVVVTPGEAFDAPGFLRISYATSMEQLREGADAHPSVRRVAAAAKAGAARSTARVRRTERCRRPSLR